MRYESRGCEEDKSEGTLVHVRAKVDLILAGGSEADAIPMFLPEAPDPPTAACSRFLVHRK
jgi:hypothetical protein